MLLLVHASSTSKNVIPVIIKRSIRSNRNPAVKVNKRTNKTTTDSTLTSLINLFHLTSTFAPIELKKLDSYLNNTLNPKDRNVSRAPEPINLLSLTRTQSDLYHEVEKVNQSNTSISQSNLFLTKSFQSPYASQTISDSDESYTTSFEKNFTLGSEPPLSYRMRRIMDTLHGTEAGGQAGLATVREKGEEIMKKEEEDRLDRIREEMEEQEEQAKDRLEDRERQ